MILATTTVEVPPILKEAGHHGKPQTASLLGQYQA